METTHSYFKEHSKQIKVFLMLNILKSSDKLSLCAFPITKKCWNIDWKVEDVTLLSPCKTAGFIQRNGNVGAALWNLNLLKNHFLSSYGAFKCKCH